MSNEFPQAQTADQGQSHDQNWGLGVPSLSDPHSFRLGHAFPVYEVVLLIREVAYWS